MVTVLILAYCCLTLLFTDAAYSVDQISLLDHQWLMLLLGRSLGKLNFRNKVIKYNSSQVIAVDLKEKHKDLNIVIVKRGSL